MNRKRLVFAVAVLVGVVVTAAVAFRSRDRLAGLPVVGALFGNAVTNTGSAARGDGGAAVAPGADPAAADPRAEVRLDLRRQQLIGVRTAPVERAEAVRTIRTVGTVQYDETRLADVNLKLEGWIREIYVDYTGKAVRRGDPLFTFYSPELLSTQQEYLLALTFRDQMRDSQIADARERAERLVQSARQRIELWDLPADQVRELEKSRQPQTAVTFHSPVDGFVIEKQALAGLHVMPGQTLYRIADLSRVWVEADLYEREIPLVAVGRPATVTLDAYPGETFGGRVVYVYPFVEEHARTVKVRFEFANRGGRLKPGMYANAELQVPLGMSTMIPANALLDSGSRQLVFVSEGDGRFEPRTVTAGQRLGDRVQILEGLDEGEEVATSAAFFLDSESQLRASVQGFEPLPVAAATAREARLDIAFRAEPDPPRTGDSTFAVTVMDPDGQPVSDAEVSVVLFMPAMPSMSMPAMRAEAKLPAVGGGQYRGPAQVMMAGRWDVTVNVSRNGQPLGSRQFAVVAK